MTPKEKALDLVNKFTGISGEKDYTDVTDSVHAKQCALIAVDELIQENEGLNSDYSCGVGYWQQVKAEIELL